MRKLVAKHKKKYAANTGYRGPYVSCRPIDETRTSVTSKDVKAASDKMTPIAENAGTEIPAGRVCAEGKALAKARKLGGIRLAIANVARPQNNPVVVCAKA